MALGRTYFPKHSVTAYVSRSSLGGAWRVRKGWDKKDGALWPQGSLSQCQCEVSRPMSWSGRNSIYLQITASKGTGNTFLCFLLQTAPCYLSGQVTISRLFFRFLVPPPGSKGSLRRLREGPVAPSHGCPGEGT